MTGQRNSSLCRSLIPRGKPEMLAFQASPDTPDGTACSSALNAARQICYWSSLFMTMMDERNVVYPITTMPSSTLEPSMSSTLSFSSSMLLQHHPIILIIKCSNVICTTRSPSLFLISSAVSKLSYRSSASHLRFFAVWAEFPSLFYSFFQCFLQCLHRSIHYYHSCPLHYLDNPQQCIHSVVNLLFPHLPVCNLSFLFILNLSQSPLRPYKLHHHFSNKFHHFQVNKSLLPRSPAHQLSTVLYPLPVRQSINIILLQSLVSYLFANHLRQVCLCHCLLQLLTSLHADKVQCHHPVVLW